MTPRLRAIGGRGADAVARAVRPYGASFVDHAADHLARWPDGPREPDLAHGLRVQAVCDALERSAAERRRPAVTG